MPLVLRKSRELSGSPELAMDGFAGQSWGLAPCSELRFSVLAPLERYVVTVC
jgi:hypothetical protein